MSEIKDYVPMLIGTTEGRRTGDIVTSTDWNTRWNLQIQQGDNTAMQVYGMTKMLFGEPSEDDPEDAEIGIFTQLSEDATKMREDLDTHVANTDNPHNVTAEQVSANPISGVAGSELQTITEDLKAQLDTKVNTVTADNTYETLEDAATHIIDVDFNEDTGEFKFYRKNGSVIGIDTALEKIAVNFRFDEANQTLYIQAIDGTEQAVPLSAFITEYEFVDTDGVTWSRNGGKISASINNAYLNSCLSAKNDAEIAKTAAETAANNAASSEANAKKSETNAKTSESNASASALSAGSAYTNADKSAKLAQSYANGTSGSRAGEATDNAKFYMEQARQAAESLENGFVPMGEITFAGLQALTNPVAGQMYTITDAFKATSDFVNTVGAQYQDHMNVYRTANGKWSVLGSFNQTVNGYKSNVITLTGNDIKLGTFTPKTTFTEVSTVNKDTTLKVAAESALSNTTLLKSGLDGLRTELQTKADLEDIDFKNGVGESLILDTKAGGIRVNKIEGKTIKNSDGTIQSSGDAGNITIEEHGDNLLPYPWARSDGYALNGITYNVSEDGWVTANGTATKEADFHFALRTTTSALKLKPGRYAVISEYKNVVASTNACLQVNSYDSTNTGIFPVVNGLTPVTYFTIPEGVTYGKETGVGLLVYVRAGTTLTDAKFRVQLREAPEDITDTTYRPYVKNTVTLPLTEPLRSVGDIKDYIAKDGIHRRIGKLAGGTVGWVGDRAVAGTTQINLYPPADFDKTTSIVVSDKFTYNQSAGSTYALNEMFVGSTKSICVFVSNTLGITDTTKAQAWIDTNEPTFYYVLAEEVIEPLTDAQKTALESLQAYDSKTYLDTTDEIAKPTLDVDYSSTSIGSELLGLKEPYIPKNGVDFFAPETGGSGGASLRTYLYSAGENVVPRWTSGVRTLAEFASKDASTLVTAGGVKEYVANKVDTLNNFLLMPDSWEDNTESMTSGLYKFVYNVSTTNYTDDSAPVWDVTGANSAYMLINAIEVKEAGYLREAVFSNTGIKVYATEKPNTALNLRVKGL